MGVFQFDRLRRSSPAGTVSGVLWPICQRVYIRRTNKRCWDRQGEVEIYATTISVPLRVHSISRVQELTAILAVQFDATSALFTKICGHLDAEEVV